MKRGVEAGDLGQLGVDLGQGADCRQVMGLVQRGELHQLFEFAHHSVVDAGRPGEVEAAVHDSVPSRRHPDVRGVVMDPVDQVA